MVNLGSVLPAHLKMVASSWKLLSIKLVLVLDKASCAVKRSKKLEVVYSKYSIYRSEIFTLSLSGPNKIQRKDARGRDDWKSFFLES